MKPTALGSILSVAILGVASAALAQAPAGSGHAHAGKPGPRHDKAGPAGSGEHPKPFGSARMLGSASPAASAAGVPGGLQRRMMERMRTVKERRDAHVRELRGRFTRFHLNNSMIMEELRHHARRVAFLNRARMIAEEELAEPKKAKVLKRIDVLLAKEQARHERHSARFFASTLIPSASAPPVASGVVPPRPSGALPGSGAPPRKPAPVPAASAGGAK
jgi:hypothetical protein